MDRVEVFRWHGVSEGVLKESEFLINSSRHLTDHSKEVHEGSTFVALRGSRWDGHDFVAGLLATPCLIIVEEGVFSTGEEISEIKTATKATIIQVPDTQRFLKEYAGVFYGHPSRRMKIVGVTGTNGKTTSTYYLEALYKALGKKTAVIGTINIRVSEEVWCPASQTTPSAVRLQGMLSEMEKKGVEVVIMEISSHALHQERVYGLEIDSVLWTNITQDHMDYHGNMEQYLEAKLKVVDLLKGSSKKHKKIVINAETTYLDVLLKRCEGLEEIYLYTTTTKRDGASMEGTIRSMGLEGMDLRICYGGETLDFKWNAVGAYNLENAMGCVLEEEVSNGKALGVESAFKILENVKVDGRLERIENPKGALVLVDYAHTPDALENVLRTLKALPHRRIICVFGCGGDRDATKRPIMGSVVARSGALPIVTSDNPRTEDPEKIVKEVVEGVKVYTQDYRVAVDRKEALAFAVSLLVEGDILVVCGKGHEDYQVIGREKIHFDDREILRSYLKR